MYAGHVGCTTSARQNAKGPAATILRSSRGAQHMPGLHRHSGALQLAATSTNHHHPQPTSGTNKVGVRWRRARRRTKLTPAALTRWLTPSLDTTNTASNTDTLPCSQMLTHTSSTGTGLPSLGSSCCPRYPGKQTSDLERTAATYFRCKACDRVGQCHRWHKEPWQCPTLAQRVVPLNSHPHVSTTHTLSLTQKQGAPGMIHPATDHPHSHRVAQEQR
jgi:hypothetical protein